jgi:hypothetical protein
VPPADAPVATAVPEAPDLAWDDVEPRRFERDEESGQPQRAASEVESA